MGAVVSGSFAGSPTAPTDPPQPSRPPAEALGSDKGPSPSLSRSSVQRPVGDHIRRLGLKLLQRNLAEELGVDTTSVFNWEANTASPEIRYMPAIIRFLGYNPLPAADTWAERLVQGRTALGLSQKEAARRMEVDPSTLAKWEQGKTEPAGPSINRATGFLADQDPQASDERLAW